MKVLVRTLLVLVLLLLAGLFLGVTYAGSLVRRAVEKGGTHVLGVETKLEEASLGVLAGKLGLDGLTVANPPGFQREHFLSLRRTEVEVSLASLRSERIESPLLLLEGLDLDLERKGDQTNYGVILANLERFQKTGEEPPPAEEPAGEGKRFVIRQVVLRDISAHVSLSALGQQIDRTVTLPELRLDNVGNDEQSLRSLISQIVTAVLEASVRSLEGVVPAELLTDLKGQVADLEAEAKKQVDEAVKQATEDVLGEVEEALEKGTGELEKGLGDLLGGKKKKDDG
jgi:hypothetical protein